VCVCVCVYVYVCAVSCGRMYRFTHPKDEGSALQVALVGGDNVCAVSRCRMCRRARERESERESEREREREREILTP